MQGNVELKRKEIYTIQPLLSHHASFNMNIVIHRQINGLNKHNRDAYATVNPTSFIASILPYQFIIFIHKQLQCINKNNREHLS